MAVAHVALDLRPGGQGGDGVHHHHIQRAGADQGFTDLQALLAGVGLGDEHGVDVHPQGPGVGGVQGVLGVDEGHLPPPLLGFGHDVEGQGRLAGGLRAVDLDDAALGHAADAQGDVQGQGASGDGVHHHAGVLPQAHDGALAVGLVQLGQAGLQRLLLIRGRRGRLDHGFLLCHVNHPFPPARFGPPASFYPISYSFHCPLKRTFPGGALPSRPQAAKPPL